MGELKQITNGNMLAVFFFFSGVERVEKYAINEICSHGLSATTAKITGDYNISLKNKEASELLILCNMAKIFLNSYTTGCL